MLNLIYTIAFRQQKYAHLVVAMLLLIASFGMTKLWVTVDATVFFSDTDPVVEEYNAIGEKYGEIKTVGLMMAPKSGNIFDASTLAAIREFSEEGATIPYSTRVTSITNYNYIFDDEGELHIDALLDGSIEYDDAQLDEIRSLYLQDTLAVQGLISTTGHVSVAVVALTMPEDPRAAITDVFQVISEIERRYSEKYPQIEFRKVGTVTGEYAFAESTERDMRSLIPLSTLLIVVMMAVLMRSLSAVGLTLMVIFVSDIIAFGFKGYVSGVVSPMTGFAPSVILTIAVADCIHLLTSYLKLVSDGMDRDQALRESLRLNYKAISLTSITTVIGFLCFNFSSSPAIRDMGNVVALGVFSAWMLTLFWLPTLIRLMPKNRHQS
ncbi:MAG: MMPL family transporter, partial [Pseudomonadales bacterium]|nr:MMPL family transporter [Pseudomonadales bacterium]